MPERSWFETRRPSVVTVHCPRRGPDELWAMLQRDSWWIDVQVGPPANRPTARERLFVRYVRHAIPGVARLGQEPRDQRRLWGTVRRCLEELERGGWRLHAGAKSSVLAILLTRQALEEAVTLKVYRPADEEDLIRRAVDDWVMGNDLLGPGR